LTVWLVMPQQPYNILLASKVVKGESKVIISFPVPRFNLNLDTLCSITRVLDEKLKKDWKYQLHTRLSRALTANTSNHSSSISFNNIDKFDVLFLISFSLFLNVDFFLFTSLANWTCHVITIYIFWSFRPPRKHFS